MASLLKQCSRIGKRSFHVKQRISGTTWTIQCLPMQNCPGWIAHGSSVDTRSSATMILIMPDFACERYSHWRYTWTCWTMCILSAPGMSDTGHRSNTASTWETWIRIWTTCLFLGANIISQLPDAQCHVNMACNQWWETWDIAIIYTGGTRIYVPVQWMSVDYMTLSPAKLNLIWTAAVNSHVMTGESHTQSWSIASVHPLHYFVAKTHNYLTIYDR